MAVRNRNCCHCGSSDTYAFNTKYVPRTMIISEEDCRCRKCGGKFPVYYDR